MNERTKPDASQVSSKEESSAPIEILSPDGELTLRQLTPSDAQELFDLIDRNREYFSQFGERISDSFQSVEAVLKSINNLSHPNKLRFGMRNREGKLMGSISLTLYPNRNIGEIGYYIGKEFSSRGITTNATSSLIEYAFTSRNLKGVFARVAEGNMPSRKVLEKAGFKELLTYPINQSENQILLRRYNPNYNSDNFIQR